MYRVVKIGSRDVPLRSTGTTQIRYKQVFRRDILIDLAKMDNKDDAEKIAAIDYIKELAYIMHMQAEGEIKKAGYDDYIEWLDGFEESDFQDEKTIQDILSTWNKNLESGSEQKKDESPQAES